MKLVMLVLDGSIRKSLMRFLRL